MRWNTILALLAIGTGVTAHASVVDTLSSEFQQGSPAAPSSPVPTEVEHKFAPSVSAQDLERARVDATITAYDLNLQLEPAESKITSLARLTLRNDGSLPMELVALQVSSSLQWDGISAAGKKLAYAPSRVVTDADHTGAATEVLIRLPRALAPRESMTLTTFYSGTLMRSTDRLLRLDVPQATAEKIEWDRMEGGGTYLRGFGNVLWYPVAAPPVLLGDGAALAREATRQKLRAQDATVHLRASIVYAGQPPGAVYFCGRRGVLTVAPQQLEPGAAQTPPGGVATVDFASELLGFRPMHLFLFAEAPEKTGELLDVMNGTGEQRAALRTAAEQVQPLLSDWFGVAPERKLTVVVQDGESFSDRTFVVAPAVALEQREVTAGALTHAWFASAQPWLDRGAAEFLSVLWLERSQGRSAALAQIQEESHALGLVESNVDANRDDGGLLAAGDEVALRNKSVSVLWMLRAITGDEALKQALQRVRIDAALDRDPQGFQRALEQTANKQLGWFFDDWVNHDRGLPDLAVSSVSPRPVPGQGGRPDGALVAVEVQNRGGAVAEVPVTVRSGSLTATERLRVPAHASASVRILFQGTPEEVQVNDGSVPEIAESTHIRRLVSQP